ncbi:LuxR C-terminal-related transcriptional regulator [Tropicimonas sp. IMCC6043]|uniref:helix-turn-helix transcriptional regulator n=1 Tax=Tropicimonas sp. IMCC6043 TaxID=2510645 RepID=UPI00101BD2AC|nr:LuxR C-terminal-related transcriptional regulator [Tropicimonas sp. IMCC6043]RYH09626.1 LuxR family transcriptional regulator [Tropicimonas sp. IMCC6043]
MDADPRTTSEQAPLPQPSKSWIEAVAGLVRASGTESFPAALRTCLEQVCPFDSMVVSTYTDNAAPVALYHDLDEMSAAVTVQFYATGPYLLDPFYLACRNNVEPGAYRLLDLAPKDFLRSNYYATFFRKIRIHDEMAILLRERENAWIAISLARSRRQRRFDEADRDRLNRILPIVEAGAMRTWHADRQAVPATDTAPQDRLRGFARDLLSRREAEIVQMILQGHSTPSIATELGIAEGTVKVHRHHAYSKLGIRSQSELFALMTRYLIETGL